MPSSTSSSRPQDSWARLPEDFRPRSLLVAVLCGLLLVAFGEVFWRSHGLRPTAPDGPLMWARESDRVLAESPQSVAILGSSRAILGIDPEAAAAEVPGLSVHQLAIYGSSPLEILRYLAEDTEFTGLVLAEIPAIAYLDSRGRSDRAPKAWLAAMNRRPLYANFEVFVRTQLHLFLASRRPGLTPLEVLRTWSRTGALPKPEHIRVLANRHIRADFSIADVAAMIEFRTGDFSSSYVERSAADQDALFAELRRLVGILCERGAKVVFLRMPSDGETWDIEELKTPRSRYWDRLAALPGAVALHFRDEPRLAAFKPGDGSHLDQHEAPGFTRTLFAILAERGLLP